jgi:hypothetical protein
MGERDPQDALAVGRCWWAGVGTRVGLVRRPKGLVILQATEEEGVAGFEYRSVTQLDVPAWAPVKLVLPK